MNKKLWIAGYFFITLSVLSCIAYMTVKVDPFFHFHKPLTDKYFYSLNNERSQNDGIEKHFEYQGLITGTSMTENFKTSEAESLWGATFIKVPFSGGTMKEINDNLVVALQHNPDLRVIIRSIEMNHFLDDFSVFSLLNFVTSTSIAFGKIDGKTLQCGCVAKSKIAANTTRAHRLFGVFY